MGKMRNGCVITEQAATHVVLSPRTLECCRGGRGGPAYVSCCDRAHDLRSNLDGLIAEDERPAAADSKDDCGRDGNEIQRGQKNNSVYGRSLKRRHERT